MIPSDKFDEFTAIKNESLTPVEPVAEATKTMIEENNFTNPEVVNALVADAIEETEPKPSEALLDDATSAIIADALVDEVITQDDIENIAEEEVVDDETEEVQLQTADAMQPTVTEEILPDNTESVPVVKAVVDEKITSIVDDMNDTRAEEQEAIERQRKKAEADEKAKQEFIDDLPF